MKTDKLGKSNEIIVFTDGASRGNPGPGGWGAVIILFQNDNRELKVKSVKSKVFELGGAEKNTTNNRMEISAAIEALLKIKDKKPRIVIYSDSSYLINGITKWIYSWENRNWITKNKEPVLNKDLWEKLLEIVKLREIEWRHIKGHAGVSGNERADEIATAFADGKNPDLFSGPFSKYKVNVFNLNENRESGIKKTSSKTRSRAKAHSYLSMVDGIIKTHETWAECEKRVKGKSGARFKKALSTEEEKEIKKIWQES